MLEPGLVGKASLLVEERHTAPRIGSGRITVLATPVMINLMESAALDAVEAHLPTGRQSLGTKIDVSHIAATPVGMQVYATAELVEVDGNRILFRVEAHDEQDLIGEGLHHRIIVDVQRFDVRIQKKSAANVESD